MKSLLRRRPSPALVIASIALFVSLSGVSYGVATGFIDSREIKNNEVRSLDIRNNQVRTRDLRNNEVRGIDIRNSTIQSRDIGLNQVTGEDVREDTLQKVPSALLADTATSATTAGSAGDASKVGGLTVKKFFVKQPLLTLSTEIFRGEGFALKAACNATDVDVQLDGVTGSPETNASWSVGLSTPEDYNFGRDNDLEPGDSHELIDLTSNAGGGTLTISTTTGLVTTVAFHAQDPPAFDGENVCLVRGTVISG